VAALADLLIDCVEGGASVSFMLPLTRDRAVAFWRRVLEDVAAGRRALLVLDAVTGGDGARLYERHGWVRVGDVPNFALYPDGGYCSTTYFYRDLSTS
jgi:hypothetical protein